MSLRSLSTSGVCRTSHPNHAGSFWPRNCKRGRFGHSHHIHRCRKREARCHPNDDSPPQLRGLAFFIGLRDAHKRLRGNLPRVGQTGKGSLCYPRLQCASGERLLPAEPHKDCSAEPPWGRKSHKAYAHCKQQRHTRYI